MFNNKDGHQTNQHRHSDRQGAIARCFQQNRQHGKRRKIESTSPKTKREKTQERNEFIEDQLLVINRKINGIEIKVDQHEEELNGRNRNDSILNLSKKVQQLEINKERSTTQQNMATNDIAQLKYSQTIMQS